MMSKLTQLLAIGLFFAFILGGCAHRNSPAPVVEMTTTIDTNKSDKYAISDNSYVVKKGETLYSIAWRADTDVRTIAALNKLSPPYKIYPGQTLKLNNSSPATVSTGSGKKQQKVQNNCSGSTSAKGCEKNVASTKPQEYVKSTPVQKAPKNKAVNRSSGQRGEVYSQKVRNWVWPSDGKIIANYSTRPQGVKGIDFGGNRGADVRAAASGKVVYAGNALRGYGNLIIVKHNDDYLSAYAHNDKLLVKEQQRIKAGQVIAKMGDSGADRVKLHFEIRFRGKSVNPAKYLPK